MQLTLKKIKVKNFRSIGNFFLEQDFDTDNKTLVVSVDNGSGKSTLTVWALYYLLFGKAYDKDVNLSDLINNRNKRDLVVEGEFVLNGKGVKLIRGMKPNKLELYVDGELREFETKSKKKDIQEFLGIDENVFLNTVLLGGERFVPFARMSAMERRNFLDGIIDTTIYTTMKKTVRDDLSADKAHLEGVQYEISSQEKVLENLIDSAKQIKKKIDRESEYDENVLVELQEQLNEFNVDLEKIEKRLAKCNEKQKKVSKKKGALADDHDRYDDLYSAKPKLEKLIEDFDPDADCSECDRRENLKEKYDTTITNKNKLKKKLKDFDKKENEIRLLSRKIESYSINIDYNDDVQKQIKETKSKLNNVDMSDKCPECGSTIDISDKKRYNKKLKKKLKELQSTEEELKPFLEQYDEDTEELQTLKNELELLEKNKHQYERLTEFIDEFDMPDECPVCVEREDTHKQNKDRIIKVLKKLDQLKESHVKYTNLMLKESKLDSFKTELNKDRSILKSSLKRVDEEIERHNQRLKKQENNNVELLEDQKEKIKEIKTKINSLKSPIKEYENKIDFKTKVLNSVLDDKSGIKSIIFNRYLGYINDRVNHYLSMMGIFLGVKLNSDYTMEMLVANRKDQAIASLSSGQRRRIDLAFLMTWRDLIANKNYSSCNLLVLDEILESLSQTGVADAVQMIDGLENTSVFIITQREEELVPMFDNVIKYDLHDGFTVRI